MKLDKKCKTFVVSKTLTCNVSKERAGVSWKSRAGEWAQEVGGSLSCSPSSKWISQLNKARFTTYQKQEQSHSILIWVQNKYQTAIAVLESLTQSFTL